LSAKTIFLKNLQFVEPRQIPNVESFSAPNLENKFEIAGAKKLKEIHCPRQNFWGKYFFKIKKIEK